MRISINEYRLSQRKVIAPGEPPYHEGAYHWAMANVQAGYKAYRKAWPQGHHVKKGKTVFRKINGKANAEYRPVPNDVLTDDWKIT